MLDCSKAVKRWGAFHNNLPDFNSNDISLQNHGILFFSHLYGRAKDLCEGIEDAVIASDDGTSLILKSNYKIDPLCLVSLVYTERQSLLSTRRRDEESYRQYEDRFVAHLAKLNPLGPSVDLYRSMAALFILGNASVDSSQRIYILAAAAPKKIGAV